MRGVRTMWPAMMIAGFVVLTSCRRVDTGVRAPAMSASVSAMADSIAHDLHAEGPNAWLRYFDHTQGFFMASDGSMAFPSNDSAAKAVPNIATVLKRVELKWGALRVDSLAPGMAQMAAPFDEVLIDAAGKEMKISGYFTGIAERGDSGWKLRNAHWSTVHPGVR